jgi:hypothetical protein
MNSIRMTSRGQLTGVGRFLLAATACALIAASPYAAAQISAPGGPQSQENRSSTMGAQPDAATSAVHESHKPQAKDAKGNARGPTVGKESKAEGAGGFNNGLYGTGAGTNK